MGFYGKLVNCIPVTRPMDKSIRGTGQVRSQGSTLQGKGTKFQSELKPGIVVESNSDEVTIVSIISDTEAECSESLGAEFMNFKIHPKLDHSLMFKAAIERLERGGTIGIFPEGRTHESPGVVKFKSGAAVIIYETLKRNVDLKVVVSGINYSEVDNLRNNCTINFSTVLKFDRDIMSGTKYEAISKITKVLQEETKKLVVPMENYDEVKLVYYAQKVFYDRTEKRVEKWREITEKLQAIKKKDGEKFTQVLNAFCGYRDVVMDLGISKYFGQQISWVNYLGLMITCFAILAFVRYI